MNLISLVSIPSIGDVSKVDTRTIVARYMGRGSAVRALHAVRAYRVIVKAQIDLLASVEALWTKQGLAVCRSLEILFPIRRRVESERDALKEVPLSFKLLQLCELLLKVAIFLGERQIHLRRRERELLQLHMLLLKIRQLVPEGFDGAVDDLLSIRPCGRRDIADILDEFRRGLEQPDGLAADRQNVCDFHACTPNDNSGASLARPHADGNARIGGET